MRALARRLSFALLALLAGSALADAPRRVNGLTTPDSVLVLADGRIVVSEIGGIGKDGDGRLSVIDPQRGARPWATGGLDDPKGLAERQGFVYVTDKTRVLRVDRRGRVSVFADAAAFPRPPVHLTDLAFDAAGQLYVADAGDLQHGGGGAIHRISPDGSVALLVDEGLNPAIRSPGGLLADGAGRLLVLDFASGELLRLDIASARTERLADGFGGGTGLARDARGRLYLSDWRGGAVWRLDLQRPGALPVRYHQAFQAVADVALARDGRHLLVADMKAGALIWLPK